MPRLSPCHVSAFIGSKTCPGALGLILPVSSTPLFLGNFRPAGRLSRRREKVAVVTLAPIIQAPSRKRIVNHYIWQCSATDRFMRISLAPEYNSMWTFNIR